MSRTEDEFFTDISLSETVSFINNLTKNFTPVIGIILGTGLSGLGNYFDSESPKYVIPYVEIPHFVRSTTISHAGNLILGTISGVPVVCMQGRWHFYEGYSPDQITFPVRVMVKLGIACLIVSNASDCLVPDWHLGDVALICGHVNFSLPNPLIGPNKDFFPPHSVRFPDMSNCYDAQLRAIMQSVAEKKKVVLREAIYFATTGPSFETPAEHRMIQTLGGSCVGMSTVSEVIVARHCGVRVLGFSMMTRLCNPAAPVPADVDGIVASSAQGTEVLVGLLKEALPLLAKEVTHP